MGVCGLRAAGFHPGADMLSLLFIAVVSHSWHMPLILWELYFVLPNSFLSLCCPAPGLQSVISEFERKSGSYGEDMEDYGMGSSQIWFCAFCQLVQQVLEPRTCVQASLASSTPSFLGSVSSLTWSWTITSTQLSLATSLPHVSPVFICYFRQYFFSRFLFPLGTVGGSYEG